MRYRLILLIALLSFAAGTISLAALHRRTGPPHASSSGTLRPPQVEDEEYAVYSALINGNLKSDKELEEAGVPKDRVLILEDSPELWTGGIPEEKESFFQDLMKNSTELEPETVNDLRIKSAETVRLERKLSIKIDYQLISSKEIEALFKDNVGGGWEAFHKKYPKSQGIMSVSRVGFNADKTQALVYRGWSCGGLCGGGSYTLLTKKKGVWVKKRDVGPTWVS